MFVKEKDEMGNGREQYRKMLERFEGIGKLACAAEGLRCKLGKIEGLKTIIYPEVISTRRYFDVTNKKPGG